MPMRELDGRSHWQHWLNRVAVKDPGGICFRQSFKWIACRLYGRPFKMGTLKAADFAGLSDGEKQQFANSGLALDQPRHNPASMVAKQRSYLDRVYPYEGRGATFPAFSTVVNQISLDTLRTWGQKRASDGSMKYNLTFTWRREDRLVGDAAFRDPEAAFVLGVYGDGSDGPWAHAMAFHHDVFFDPNGGEYGFDRTDDRGEEIQQHCERRYAGEENGVVYRVRNYVLYFATKRGGV